MSGNEDGESDCDSEYKLPEWAKCSVCSELPTSEDVRFLPCLHLVCSLGCLHKIKMGDSDTISCKTCAKSHLITEASTSAYLLECQERQRLTESSKDLASPPCTYCIRGTRAVAWCEKCSEHLCDMCSEQHGYATRTRNHRVEDVRANSSKTLDVTNTSHTLCTLHEKPLTHFCTSCVNVLCDVCAKKRHMGHAINSLKNLADDTRKNIKGSLKMMESMLPVYEQMEQTLTKKAKHMITTQQQFLVAEASAQIARVLSALMRREMEQRKELTETVVHKTKELNLKTCKVRSLYSQTQHFLDVCKDLLKDGSDWAVITNRQTIEAQLFSLRQSANSFSTPDMIDSYVEKGFNMVMDKSLGHQAERHVLAMAKILYSFNPKAPKEIKFVSSEEPNSRSNFRNGEVQVSNKTMLNSLFNKSRTEVQHSPTTVETTVSRNPIKSERLRRPSMPAEIMASTSSRTPQNALVSASSSLHQRIPGNSMASAPNSEQHRLPQKLLPLSVAHQRKFPKILAPTLNFAQQRTPQIATASSLNSAQQKTPQITTGSISHSAQQKTPQKFIVSRVNSVQQRTPPKAVASNTTQQINLQNVVTSASAQERTSRRTNGNLVESANAVLHVAQQYPNLTDQLIIEPVDDSGSDIEDSHPIVKSDSDDTDVVPDDYEETLNPPKSRLASKRNTLIKFGGETSSTEATQVVSPIVIRQSTTSLNKQSNSKTPVKRRRKDSHAETRKDISDYDDQNGNMNGSESEGGLHNDAPNLTPETMKAPPKLRRAGDARASSSRDTTIGGPPVLVPSVSLPLTERVTPELGPLEDTWDRGESGSESAGPITRNRRKSGRLTPSCLPQIKEIIKPGPTTRRRGSVTSVTSEISTAGPATRRGRSASRCRSVSREVTPELPAKRERKKKSNPEFVEEDLRKKIRSGRSSPATVLSGRLSPATVHSGRSSPAAITPNTTPSPNTSTSSTESKKKTPKRRGRKRGKSRGKKAPNQDFSFELPAEELDFPLVREDKMRIDSSNCDDNEDYCYICLDGGGLDGGDGLLCCDLCPKVYHIKCHMPTLDNIPEGDWQCLFCKTRDDVFNLPDSQGDDSLPPDSLQYVNNREFMIACKFLSDLYSLKESGVTRSHFENLYRTQFNRLPSSLIHIRLRLTLVNPNPYQSFAEMLEDLHLMFSQAYELYSSAHKAYEPTKEFERKFLEMFEEYRPHIERSFTSEETEEPSTV